MQRDKEVSTFIAQAIRENPLPKFLHKKLKIPRHVIQPFLEAGKIARHPRQYLLRKQLAKEIVAADKTLLVIPDRDGFRLFGPEDIEGIGEVVRHCSEVYETSRHAFSAEYFQRHPQKKFLLPILEGVEFCRHPALLRFMVSRPLVDSASAYLGTVPRLAGARLCWSPPNETSRSSQLFHFDYEDVRQLKVFINIFETNEEQGPLTFLPAGISAQVQKTIGSVVGRVQDEPIYEAGGRHYELKLIGPAGSGAFLDTSRCLHFGSRFNQKDRLVLIIQFLRCHSSYRSTAPFQVSADAVGFNLDFVQKLALGIN